MTPEILKLISVHNLHRKSVIYDGQLELFPVRNSPLHWILSLLRRAYHLKQWKPQLGVLLNPDPILCPVLFGSTKWTELMR